MKTEQREDHNDTDVFSWQETKSARLMIYWRGREIMTLKGDQATKLSNKLLNVEPTQQQMLLAKITGNFKRGNEKQN